MSKFSLPLHQTQAWQGAVSRVISFAATPLRDLVEEAKMRDGLVRSAEGWQWTRIEIRKHCGSGTIAPQAEGQPWEANDDQRF